MASLSSFLSCLCGSGDDYQPLNALSTHPRFIITRELRPEAQLRACRNTTRHLTPAENVTINDIIAILRDITAHDSNKHETAKQIDNAVTAQGGWAEWIAEGVLAGIEKILQEAPEKMGSAMRAAFEQSLAAAQAVFDFTQDHPVAAAGLLTIVAIGILVLVAPVVVEALGFAELGPLEGMSPAVMFIF